MSGKIDDAVNCVKRTVKERIILIVGNLADAMRVYELGIRFTTLNLGNIHHEESGRKITPSVIVNREDEAIIGKFRSLGVSIEIRDAGQLRFSLPRVFREAMLSGIVSAP
jgi:mannose/fructose/N-acetylgalactosamine-specific phosphotransferase system component IIB